MEIWFKYLKFVVIWTIITTALIWFGMIMVGDFNGQYLCINWQPFIYTLLISNCLLNIYLVNEMKN